MLKNIFRFFVKENHPKEEKIIQTEPIEASIYISDIINTISNNSLFNIFIFNNTDTKKNTLELSYDFQIKDQFSINIRSGILEITQRDNLSIQQNYNAPICNIYIDFNHLIKVLNKSVGDIFINNDLHSDNNITLKVSSVGHISATSVSADKVIQLESSSVGGITLDTLNAHLLNAKTTSIGSINVNSGNCSRCNLEVKSTGSINAKNLISQDAFILITSIGDISIFANNLIEGKITSLGRLHVNGDPKILVKTSNGGKVR